MKEIWAERLLGHARSARALDDPWSVAACAIELEALVGDGDLRDAAMRAAPIRAAGAEAMGQFERSCVGVVRWACERRPSERDEAAHELAGSVAALLAIDPVVDLARPRYRWRVPWRGDGLAAFHALLAPVFARVTERPGAVPDGNVAIARCEALAAEAGVEPGAPASDAMLAASRAAIHRLCDDMLARDAVWHEPLRAAHARGLRAAVDAATTPNAIDLACHHAGACFAIEAAWLHALVATAGAPLRAALLASYEPSVDAGAAREVATAITGEPDPLRLPWLAALIDNFARHSAGAHLGEAGFELLAPYRTWQGLGIGDMELHALTATTTPALDRTIALWDREVAIADAGVLRETGIFARPSP